MMTKHNILMTVSILLLGEMGSLHINGFPEFSCEMFMRTLGKHFPGVIVTSTSTVSRVSCKV